MNRKGWLPVFGLLAGLALGLWALPAAAQGEVGASLSASADTVTVGDAITMTVTVIHPASHQVILPKLGPTWGDFEVRSQSKTDTSIREDGRATTQANFVVTLLKAPGEYRTPDLTVTVSDAQGNTHDAQLNPLTVTVKSVLTAEDQALRDLKPQAKMTPPPIWPWLLLGLAAAALLFLAGRWLWRRWRRDRTAAPAAVIDPRLAYQVAYDELDRIQGLALPEQAEYKTHYTLVTDCLRRYLEGQFRVRAMDRTTSEIRAGLRGSVVAGEPAREIVRLFEESDLVKFAKFVPTQAAARQALTQARRFVDRTRRPQAEEPDTVGGSGGAFEDKRLVEMGNAGTTTLRDAKTQLVEENGSGGER